MEQIYFLLLAATSVLSILGTIIYFKWDNIKALGRKKITFIFTKSSVRDEIFEIMKDLNPQYKDISEAKLESI